MFTAEACIVEYTVTKYDKFWCFQDHVVLTVRAYVG